MLRRTVIVPIGLVLDLNHHASIGAFTKLSQQPGKMLDGEKLVFTPELMLQILERDNDFKAGRYKDVAQFRKDILELFHLQATDTEFDQAWNAMQGDLSQLSSKLLEVKKRYSHLNIIWISKTNPIHLKSLQDALATQEQKQEGSTLVLGDNFFASCCTPAVKSAPDDKTDVVFYQDVIKNKIQDNDAVSLIIQLESRSPIPVVKERDDRRAQLLATWGKEQHFTVIARDAKQDLASLMTTHFPKPYDGQFSHWLKSPEKTIEQVEARHAMQSNSFRPR